MIVVMQLNATKAEVDSLINRLEVSGFQSHIIKGTNRLVIGAVGFPAAPENPGLERMPGVEKVVPIMQPYKLAGREIKPDDTVINVKGIEIGGRSAVVIAGPCAVESREQLLEAAVAVKKAGASIIRGGAFKPRTSPYSFQGLEEEGLEILKEAGNLTGLPVITEVIDERSAKMACDYADILQVGARNMQNFQLLKLIGQTGKPVMLKRGISATINEWLMAAEYIMAQGNYKIILCERGIRTFETATRNTLDISAIPVVKGLSHLPIMVDPSHASGDWRLVSPLARAGLACGAHGVMVEVHPNPKQALCDGQQSLSIENFKQTMKDLSMFIQ
ncbi:3-deoxy-7-phosphoheptulonate synthase [Metallumcola ferriviriculae]|uniref:3-deoxy-7-phosphoheptulonate synthase n=1 Tax=Metallumcola ferriviriculae TaxID=3039180 RepID=A0AAU0UNT9_9FIRM|nr:3-deoxy-7-phosphoheptulonate synthase [Desulfitibacteraceae bacterium MK1]